MRGLSDAPLPFLRCRAFGHTWEEFIPVGKRKPEWGFRISLLCTSCSMERHDVIDTAGGLSHRQYLQPDDYSGIGGYSRAEYRLAYNKARRRKELVKQRTQATLRE